MTVLQQTKHLLYRNYLLKMRNKKETLQEILLPIFLMLLLAGIRATFQTRDEPAIERKYMPKFSLLRHFPLFVNGSKATPTVAFVSNNLKKASDIVAVLRAYAGSRLNFTDGKSVQEMTASYRTQKKKFAFGIVFEESKTSYLGVKYTLLSPYKNQPSTIQKLIEIGKESLNRVVFPLPPPPTTVHYWRTINCRSWCSIMYN